MNARLHLIQNSSLEVLTLADVAAHLRVDCSEEAVLIATYLKAAWTEAERFTGLSLLPQKWDAVYDRLPGERDGSREPLELPRSPVLQSSDVEFIRVIDPDGTENTWASSNYQVDVYGARIIPVSGWPSRREWAGLRVRFTAGFSSPQAIPFNIRQALLLAVADWFENRQDTLVGTYAGGTVYQLPNGSRQLLMQEREWLI